MAGLVAYDSSDEDEEVTSVPESKPINTCQTAAKDEIEPQPSMNTSNTAPEALSKQPENTSGDTIGPQIGPSAAPGPGDTANYYPPLEDAEMDDDDQTGNAAGALPTGEQNPPPPPGSPYSSTRATLRDLTLPTVPNLDIPPSPPGSPEPATTRKLEQFLDLKRRGVHFNTKIANSPQLRNPALTDKLLAFAGLSSSAAYVSSLPPELLGWDPDSNGTSGFPRHAFKERLKQAQVEEQQARARVKGEKVDFVSSSSSTGAGNGSLEGGTNGGGSVLPATTAGKRKTRFES